MEYFPHLDLAHYSGWAKLKVAAQFLPMAQRAISEKRLRPQYTFHLMDRNEIPLGVSSGDVSYRATYDDVRTICQIAVDIEDRRYFSHRGVDVYAIGRALIQNAKAGRIVQGGSTITQQLVRNTLLSPDRSFARKVAEAILAITMERHYSKQEILYLYSQFVYLGPGVRGFSAAAKLIYRRRIEKLDIPACFGLVGLLRMPSVSFPSVDNGQFLARQEFLSRTYRLRFGVSKNCDRAASTATLMRPVKYRGLDKPRWTIFARRFLSNQSSSSNCSGRTVVRVGFTIHRKLQDTLDRLLNEASLHPNIADASGVVLDHRTGDVLAESAWSLGQDGQFSPTFFGAIQPGSTFKTFALLAALEEGFSSELELESSKFQSAFVKDIKNRPWQVRNYAEQYLGNITLLEAFRHSDNSAFARLSEMLDFRRMQNVYRRFGLCQNSHATHAIVLGGASNGVSLLTLASAYAAIAHDGACVKPRFIRYAQYDDGSSQHFAPSSESALLIEDYSVVCELKAALAHASGRLINYGFSGKSGTTRRASLFVGYNDAVSVALWLNHRIAVDERTRKGLKASVVLQRLSRTLLGYRDDVFVV